MEPACLLLRMRSILSCSTGFDSNLLIDRLCKRNNIIVHIKLPLLSGKISQTGSSFFAVLVYQPALQLLYTLKNQAIFLPKTRMNLYTFFIRLDLFFLLHREPYSSTLERFTGISDIVEYLFNWFRA